MLQGNLKDRQVPALLTDLYFSNKTGMLTIESDEMIKQLCIRDGTPVAARSNLLKDRLGDFLVGKGIITTEQQQRALEIQKKKQLGFAASLIEMDAVSKERLFAETRRIFLTIIYSLFDLREGVYRFEEKELPKKNLYYKVAFPGFFLFGVRQIWDSQSIEEIIGDLNSVPIPTQNFSEDQSIRFTENEQSVIQQIDSKRTINEILKSSEIASLIGLKVFLFLFLYRWIELVKSTPKEEPEEVTKIAEPDESAQHVKSGYMEDEISRTVEGVLAVSDEAHEPSLEKDEEIQSKDAEEVQVGSGPIESEEEALMTPEAEPSKETEKSQGWPHILFEDLKPISTVTEEQDQKQPIQELEEFVEKEYAEPPREPVEDEVVMTSEEEQEMTEEEKPTSQEEEEALIPSETFQGADQKKKKRVRKKTGLFSSLALILIVAAGILFISPWYDDVKDRVRTYFSGEQSEWASLEKSQWTDEDLSVPDDQGENKPEEKTLEVIPHLTIVVEPEDEVIQTESAETLVETEMVEVETAVTAPEKSPHIPAIQPEEEVLSPAAIEEGAGRTEESAVLAELEKPEKEKPEQEEIQEEDKLVQSEEKVKDKVGSAKVLGVRYTEGENSMRVEIDLDAPAEYKIFQLPEQHMVYLSLRNTRLSPEISQRRIIIPDRNLNAVRLGQYKSDRVRVVLDFDKVTVVSAFALTDPHRIILDVATSESDE